MPAILFALLLALGPLVSLAQPAPPDRGKPAMVADGWDAATPDDVGLDPAVLSGIGPRFQGSTDVNVHAVLVIRHGKLGVRTVLHRPG